MLAAHHKLAVLFISVSQISTESAPTSISAIDALASGTYSGFLVRGHRECRVAFACLLAHITRIYPTNCGTKATDVLDKCFSQQT